MFQSIQQRTTALLAETEAANQEPNASRVLPHIIQILRDLEVELTQGQASAERLKSYGYGIYRTVEGDAIENSKLREKLLNFSADLAGEKKT